MDGGLAPAARFTTGFQPEIVPSSVAKIKAAAWPAGVPLFSRKSVGLPLNTTPVGADCVPAGAKPGGGTVMKFPEAPPDSVKMLAGFPVPVNRLEVPELLLPIQKGLPARAGVVEERVSPQGFFRLGSMVGAIPTMSETRFVCLYCCACVTDGSKKSEKAKTGRNFQDLSI